MLNPRWVKTHVETMDAVSAALRSADLPDDSDGWDLVDHGGDHIVILTPDAAVRVARHHSAAELMEQRLHLVEILNSYLPFDLPTPLGAVARVGATAAVATKLIHGVPATQADPAVFGRLLTALHEVPVEAVADVTPPPMSYVGGPDWPQHVADTAIPLLDADVRSSAEAALQAVTDAPSVPPVLTHGDLGGSNVLWDLPGSISGVLDWDLAALDDPAVDVACLASFFGWPTVTAIVDRDTIERAQRYERLNPVLTVAHLVLTRTSDDPEAYRTARFASPTLR